MECLGTPMLSLNDFFFVVFRINKSIFFVSKIGLHDFKACRGAFAKKICKIALFYEKELAPIHKVTNLQKIFL